MKLCSTCGTERDDDVDYCPHCGNHAHCWLPTKAEIAAACEQIQGKWGKVKELARRAENNGVASEAHYEIPRVHEPGAGRKRRRGGER